jgi:myosin heavy subunit
MQLIVIFIGCQILLTEICGKAILQTMATVSDLAIRDAYEAHADRLDDLTLLSTIEDESIAEHLTKRHAEGEMYTAIG